MISSHRLPSCRFIFAASASFKLIRQPERDPLTDPCEYLLCVAHLHVVSLRNRLRNWQFDASFTKFFFCRCFYFAANNRQEGSDQLRLFRLKSCCFEPRSRHNKGTSWGCFLYGIGDVRWSDYVRDTIKQRANPFKVHNQPTVYHTIRSSAVSLYIV